MSASREEQKVSMKTKKQLRLPLHDLDRDFMREYHPSTWPESLLVECRARRIGCSVGEIRSMRSYELAREIADEVALQSLGQGNERIAVCRYNWELIDSIARRESIEQMKDFKDWRASQLDDRRLRRVV